MAYFEVNQLRLPVQDPLEKYATGVTENIWNTFPT